VDVRFLAEALQTILDRHPTLRTTFSLVDGVPVGRIRPGLTLDLAQVEIADDAALAARIDAESSRLFDLRRGPLLRAVLFSRSQWEHVLLLVTHALAADRWSVVLLLDELRVLYPALKEGRTAPLPTPDLGYDDFTRDEAAAQGGAEGERCWQYWDRELS